MTREMDRATTNLVVASSVASIGLAIYLYARGEKQAAIFVGLWAPTILGLGSFLKGIERELPVSVSDTPVAPVAQ